MNYWALKWLIETVVQEYTCPECNSKIANENIDIVWAAWNTINIDIECSSCWKHSMVKSEVLMFDLAKMPISKDNVENIKSNMEAIREKLLEKKDELLERKSEVLNKREWLLEKKDMLLSQKQRLIKDEEIISLNTDLKKKNCNVTDLFWNK